VVSEVPSPAGTEAGCETAVFDGPNDLMKGDCALVAPPKGLFAAVLANKLLPVAALGLKLNSPPDGAFVFVLASLEDFGEGAPKPFPLGEVVGSPNNPPIGFVLEVPESASLVASQLNTTDFAFVLSGFGEGVRSFGLF